MRYILKIYLLIYFVCLLNISPVIGADVDFIISDSPEKKFEDNFLEIEEWTDEENQNIKGTDYPQDDLEILTFGQKVRDYLVNKIKNNYPTDLIKTKIEGTVSVYFTINEFGYLTNVYTDIDKSTIKMPEFHKAAINSIKSSFPFGPPYLTNEQKFFLDINYTLPEKFSEKKDTQLIKGDEKETQDDNFSNKKLSLCKETPINHTKLKILHEWNNCIGRYESSIGIIYEGEFKNGLRDGQGKTINPNGNSYEGEWRNNLRHGKGVFKWKIPDKEYNQEYEGSYVNGVRDGLGSFFDYNTGEKYIGYWKNGSKHGKGAVHDFADGSSYLGDYENDLFNGHGTRNYPNGDKYEGNWSNGKRHGMGKLIDKKGNSYDGNWKNDEKDGKGVEVLILGFRENRIQAYWKNNKKHGEGTLTTFDGDQYKVKYENGIIISQTPINNKSDITYDIEEVETVDKSLVEYDQKKKVQESNKNKNHFEEDWLEIEEWEDEKNDNIKENLKKFNGLYLFFSLILGLSGIPFL